MSRNKKQKSIKAIIFSDVLLIICVCMLLYPISADIWNAKRSSYMASSYDESVKNINEEDYSEILEAAEEYNKQISNMGTTRFNPESDVNKNYMDLLKIDGTDVIAYLTVPKIGITNMPVYHTTSSAVLQAGVGHYEGSSLPIGGESTHSVLSGHTGMAGLKMFSELNKLEKGDIFQIKVLGETLTYQVDQFHQVSPSNLDYLKIEEGKDLCTLITCIPIGINSERLLVRGHRIEKPTEEEYKELTSNNSKFNNPILQWFENIWNLLIQRFALYEIVMTGIAVLILLIFIVPDFIKLIKQSINRRKQKSDKKEI